MSKELDNKSPSKLTMLGIASCPLIFSNSKQIYIHLFPSQQKLSMSFIHSQALLP